MRRSSEPGGEKVTLEAVPAAARYQLRGGGGGSLRALVGRDPQLKAVVDARWSRFEHDLRAPRLARAAVSGWARIKAGSEVA